MKVSNEKEFYIDSYNNFVFKTTFKQYEEIIDAYSHDISAAVPANGNRIVGVSINKTKFKEAIIAMTQTRDSVYQMELYADFSFLILAKIIIFGYFVQMTD